MSANVHPIMQAALAPVTPPACAHARTVPLIQNRARCLDCGETFDAPCGDIVHPDGREESYQSANGNAAGAG